MLLKRKILIYSILLSIVFSLIFPTISLCTNQDSLYVWSSLVSTSTTPSYEEQEESNENSNR